MTARVNSAEGGTDGATVTEANSGGTSGNAWDSLNIPSGTTLKFATAAAYKGTKGYRVTSGTTTGTGASVRWSLEGWPQVRLRFYARFAALPTANGQVVYVGNLGHSETLARVQLTPGGQLRVLDFNGVVLWTSTGTLSVNTWYRFEFIVVPGTSSSNGTIRFAYATTDGAVTESYGSTAVNTGSKQQLGRMYVGKLAGTWNTNLDIDDLAADDQSNTTLLGASAASGTPVVVDPTPPPNVVTPPATPPVDLYSEAIRSSLAIWWTVSATYGGAPVEGASGLYPVGGSIVDTSKPGVRRTLSLDIVAEAPRTNQDLYELLSPIGTTLTVTAHIRYTNQQVVDIPMGVFDVDSSKISEGGGALSLTAPDKWVRIQRARFLYPSPSYTGVTVRQQIVNMIHDALGPNETVNDYATSSAMMAPQVFDKDRDKAIIDLAQNIGAWVYFDRNGIFTIEDIPASGSNATVWPIDASDDGVQLQLDREQSRTNTYNIVVVSSSATDGEKFPVQYVWDDDPGSVTYAGTSPYDPAGAGPFGLVPYYYDTPILTTVSAARNAGLTILYRVTGLSSQVSLTAAPNPAIDAFDVLSVLPPPEFFGDVRTREMHIVDTVTHPLALRTPQQIDARSTRADAITGGS